MNLTSGGGESSRKEGKYERKEVKKKEYKARNLLDYREGTEKALARETPEVEGTYGGG